jgi:hypothetical protein
MRIGPRAEEYKEHITRGNLHPAHQLHFAVHGNAQDGVEALGVVHVVPVVGVSGCEREFDEQVERVCCVEEGDEEGQNEQADEARGCGVAGVD